MLIVKATKRNRSMAEQIEQEEPSVQAKDEKLVGIRGWLILPAIGFVLGTLIRVSTLIVDIGAYSTGMYSDVARAGIDEIYTLEFIISLSLTGLLIYATILFLKKKKNAPKVIIALHIASIVALYVFLVFELDIEAKMFAVEIVIQLVNSVIAAVIWIPYFVVSKRVKATFVN
jgi:hypothetical protein